MNTAARVTVEIKFCASLNGHRYALYRIKGWNALTWHGLALPIAERALHDGVVPIGRLKGALAVPAAEPAAAAYGGALNTQRQSVKGERR